MASVSYEQLMNEISKIVSEQVNSALSNLNMSGGEKVSATSFEMQSMSNLMSGMSLPQEVFRKYLHSIFPITVSGSGEAGDMLLVNDEKDVVFNSGLKFFKGVYAAAEIDKLDDSINPLSIGLESGDIVLEKSSGIFWKYLWLPDDYEFDVVDGDDEDVTYVIGNYYFLKVGIIEDLKDGMLVQAGEKLYKKSESTLVELPTLEDLDLRLRALESNE